MNFRNILKTLMWSFCIGIFISVLINYGIIPPSGKYGKFNFNTLNLQGMIIMSILTSSIIFLYMLLVKRSQNSKITIVCPKCESVKEVLKSNSKEITCHKCQTRMIPLHGFYNKPTHKD